MNKNNLHCDVNVCMYNDGCNGCTKDKIAIVTGKDSKTAHYCADFQE